MTYQQRVPTHKCYALVEQAELRHELRRALHDEVQGR